MDNAQTGRYSNGDYNYKSKGNDYVTPNKIKKGAVNNTGGKSSNMRNSSKNYQINTTGHKGKIKLGISAFKDMDNGSALKNISTGYGMDQNIQKDEITGGSSV